jgi:hypothetical protein
MEIPMHEHLGLQQRLVDQELEGHRQQRAFFGRELEAEMFPEEPLRHQVEFALEGSAIIGLELLGGARGAHLDVGECGQGFAVQRIHPATGAQQGQVLRVAQILHHDQSAAGIEGMHMRHMGAGLLQQRRHLQIRTDVFLAGRRVHDHQRIGLGRPGRRVYVAAGHTEITSEAGVGGCHADAADPPTEVLRQPGLNE